MHQLGQANKSGRTVANITLKEKQMKPSTKDKIEGTLHEAKGKVKEKAGQATNNSKLEQKGKAENFAGKVQKRVGQIETVLEK
jgi:uncharacterized protein YjbJ (UPF0337 family)